MHSKNGLLAASIIFLAAFILQLRAGAQCAMPTQVVTKSCQVGNCNNDSSYLAASPNYQGYTIIGHSIPCCGVSFPATIVSVTSCGPQSNLIHNDLLRQRLILLALTRPLLFAACAGRYEPLQSATLERKAERLSLSDINEKLQFSWVK